LASVAGEREREEKAFMPRLSAEGLDAGWLAALNAIVLLAAGAHCTRAKGLFCMQIALAKMCV
jgi:hypothetical protein